MGQTRFLVAGKVIDGTGGVVRKRIFLAVQEGRIIDIGPAEDLKSADRHVIDDLSHCIILPALVDCTIALTRSPAVNAGVRPTVMVESGEESTALFQRHIGYCHAHGVLGLAENDTLSDAAEHCRGEIVAKGAMDIRTSSGLKCDSQNRPGDFLRIDYSGSIEEENTPSLRLQYTDLCRLLQSRGDKKAIVVANGAQYVAEALMAGCDAIEQGYGMGEDNLRKMAALGTLWIPSVLRAKNGLDGAGSGGDVCCRFSQRYVAPGKPVPGAEVFWHKTLEDHLAQLNLARKLGVKTAVGTGAGNVGILHGESVVEEMKLFIKAGYSLVEAVQCASDNGAGFFGMENLGRLEIGRKATFITTRGMLPQLPRKLSYLEGIYIDGKPDTGYRKNPVKVVYNKP